MTRQTLVVGLGSGHGDDRAGWLAAAALAAPEGAVREGNETLRICTSGSAADLLDWIDDCQRLIVCDAVRGAGAPGTVHAWEWPDERLRAVTWGGSHDLPLAAVLELAGRLQRLPRQVLVCGIEAAECQPGTGLSPAVAAGLPALVAQVRRRLPGA